MTTDFAALAAISASPPALGPGAIAAAVGHQFGLVGTLSPLVSERDQNFLLSTGSGEKFVVKVTSAYEDAMTTDFQIGALLHFEKAGHLLVPRVRHTRSGDTSAYIADNSSNYRLRVVSWVNGEPLEGRGLDTHQARDVGKALARLDLGLSGYAHAGENPVLLWDLGRAAELRSLVDNIAEPSARSSVTHALADFESHVLPDLAGLRSQVIHADPNPGNILVADTGIGFIDFGDMMRAPLVFDVAIAASYLRCFAGDPLAYIAPFVEGYHSAIPLEGPEADLLFDLVRARLATTVTLLHWRLSARAENDPYRKKALATEGDAGRFLARLDDLGRTKFREKLEFIQ